MWLKTTVFIILGAKSPIGQAVPAGSKVKLIADKRLVLNSPQGEELWKSDPITEEVAYGYMNDTGNYALEN